MRHPALPFPEMVLLLNETLFVTVIFVQVLFITQQIQIMHRNVKYEDDEEVFYKLDGITNMGFFAEVGYNLHSIGFKLMKM